jgi:KaiC/GvpD/RAD55 family RecA-like ATPase
MFIENPDCGKMIDYTLGIKEIDDQIGEIKRGSNILLIGPSMTGKEAITNHIIHDNTVKNDNAVMVVTANEPGISILERFERLEPKLLTSRVGVVDCISTKYGGYFAVENENIKFVNSPEDLTTIGIKISQFFEDFFIMKKIPNIQLHIVSLSTFLMYSNIQTVFKFLHILTGRIKMADAIGIYVIDSEMHDLQTITAIKLLCDCMIEVKSENDKNFIRTVGILSEPTPWLEYQIKGEKLMIIKEGMTFDNKNIQQDLVNPLVNG